MILKGSLKELVWRNGNDGRNLIKQLGGNPQGLFNIYEPALVQSVLSQTEARADNEKVLQWIDDKLVWDIKYNREAIRSNRRSEEHTSELQSLTNLVCRLLLEKKKTPPQRLRKMPVYGPDRRRSWSQRSPARVEGRYPRKGAARSRCIQTIWSIRRHNRPVWHD